jgi:hypothetical protein
MAAGYAAKTLCPAAIDEHPRTPADCNQRIPPGLAVILQIPGISPGCRRYLVIILMLHQ